MKLALIGDPIAHSQSPLLHAEFLEQADIEGTYSALCVSKGDGANAVRRLASSGYDGCNVTYPLKEEVLSACDRLTDEARRARAVNTIAFGRHIVGANTDGIGARLALEEITEGPLSLRRIGVLGYGATARAILVELHDNDVYSFVWGRSADHVAAVCAEFEASPWPQSGAPEYAIGTLPPNADLPDWIAEQLRSAEIVIDANYGERATLAERLGREVIDGEAMLRAQARASFDFWLTSMQDANFSDSVNP